MLFEALASGTGGGEWSYIVLMKAPLNAAIVLDDGDEEVETTGAGVDTLIGIPLHNGSSAYTLTVTMNGLTAPTQTVNTPADTTPSGGISDVITVNFAKLHITYDENFRGQTMSLSDGTHTASPSPVIPATGNTFDVYVPYTGNWSIEATDPVSGDPFPSSPDPVPVSDLTATVNVGLYVIPNGAQVTPTDVIDTWLLCADVKNTGYTTLAQVLADEDVLFKVLTSDNANDYLKRSKTWATGTGSITDSELAMQIIGADDYASETLLSDSDWCEAICNSEYFEDVLNAKNPIMTANDAPSGYVASASSVYGNRSDLQPWVAFDGIPDASHAWAGANSEDWIKLKFLRAFNLRKVGMVLNNTTYLSIVLEGSDDDSDWTPLKTWTNITTQTTNPISEVLANNVDSFKYYRLTFKLNSVNINVYEIYFYGREAAGVQTWLKAADIERPYTTLAEVLSDHVALQKLMSSHDAVDYLVTAKAWIDTITSDATAMRYIGKRNYAADTLLADSEWCEGICGSAYRDSVVSRDLPISGTANGTYAGDSRFTVDHSYDGSTATEWAGPNANTVNGGDWAIYNLGSKKKVASIDIVFATGTSADVDTTIQIFGSDDPSNFTDELVPTTPSFKANNPWTTQGTSTEKQMRNFILNAEYQYFKVVLTKVTSNGNSIGIGDIYFFEREDVDETKIDIISATNDTVYKLVNGSPVNFPTLTGNTVQVNRTTDLPNGTYILGSTTAKDPDDLTADYRKEVVIDDDIFEVAVMPDDALYWYGYLDGNCEAFRVTNSGVSSTLKVTFDTNKVTCPSDGNGSNGLVNKNALENGVAKKASVISKVTSAYGNHYTSFWRPTSKLTTLTAPTEEVNKQLNTLKYDRLDINSDSKYAYVGQYDQSANEIHAFWLSKPNPLANFFSAPNDNVYYMSGGVQVPFCKTDEYGGAVVNYAQYAGQTLTLFSSVAKDPDNLSNPYSKEVTISANTKKVYLMPDNVIYWFGYESDNLEDMSTNNGWGNWSSGITWETPTRYNNYIDLTISASSKARGIATKNAIPTVSKWNCIVDVDTPSNYPKIDLCSNKSSYSDNLQLMFNTTSGLQVGTLNDTYGTNRYGEIEMNGSTSAFKVYAFWYE